MSKKYRLVVCPNCSKHFNPKQEGFNVGNRLICADCYKYLKFKTFKDKDLSAKHIDKVKIV